jgi:hypothetical protein
MGLRVHPRVIKKLHDLETSSFAHYKKNSKLSHLQKKQWRLCLLWDCEDLLLCDFLPPKTTISSDKYSETLEKVRQAIKQKRPGRLTAGARLLPRQRPGCKRGSGKLCSIHHIDWSSAIRFLPLRAI